MTILIKESFIVLACTYEQRTLSLLLRLELMTTVEYGNESSVKLVMEVFHQFYQTFCSVCRFRRLSVESILKTGLLNMEKKILIDVQLSLFRKIKESVYPRLHPVMVTLGESLLEISRKQPIETRFPMIHEEILELGTRTRERIEKLAEVLEDVPTKPDQQPSPSVCTASPT